VRKHLGSFPQEANPKITLQTTPEGVDLFLTAQATMHQQGEQLLLQAEQRLRAELADYIFGTGDCTLQQVIGSALDEQQLTLATIESLTGGLIASALTDEHCSSAHFFGGIIAYSVPLKERIGVPQSVMDRYGIVSAETARAMAHAVRTFLDIDVGLGITGVAGPDPQEGKPVGTVSIAIDGPYGLLTGIGSERCASSDREENKHAATISALNLLRRYLEGRGKGGEPCRQCDALRNERKE
jgi:nicotinamide-nucleotide amidase